VDNDPQFDNPATGCKCARQSERLRRGHHSLRQSGQLGHRPQRVRVTCRPIRLTTQSNLSGVYTLRLVVSGKDGALAEDRVTVEVGGVIPNAWGATVKSGDGRVALNVPEQAYQGLFPG